MMEIIRSLFKSKSKKLSFMTTLVCLDCEHLFDSSRTAQPCPYCASKATIPAANWSPIRFGMPNLAAARMVNNG